MKHDDLIAFLIEEAQHRVINDERMKNAETALAAHAKRTATRQAGQRKRPDKLEDSDYDVTCGNCKNQDMWKPTVTQRAEEKKVKHHGRKGSPKRQRQRQWQQSMMTMMSCSHSHAPLITQMSPQPSNYQNPNWAHV